MSTDYSTVRFSVEMQRENISGTRYLNYTAIAYQVHTDDDGRTTLWSPDSYALPYTHRHDELAHLCVRASRMLASPDWYSQRWGYGDFYPSTTVTPREVTGMAKAVARIERRWEALNARFGGPEGLAAYTARIAAAVTSPKTERPFWRRAEPNEDYEGTGYYTMNTTELDAWIRREVEKFQNDYVSE